MSDAFNRSLYCHLGFCLQLLFYAISFKSFHGLTSAILTNFVQVNQATSMTADPLCVAMLSFTVLRTTLAAFCFIPVKMLHSMIMCSFLVPPYGLNPCVPVNSKCSPLSTRHSAHKTTCSPECIFQWFTVHTIYKSQCLFAMLSLNTAYSRPDTYTTTSGASMFVARLNT